MKFRLTCVRLDSPEDVKAFYYDNQTGLLHDGRGDAIGEPRPSLLSYTPSFKANAAQNPIRKHDSPRVLKIQMGLSCNYSCDYCLQKYVPHADEAGARLVPGFIEAIKTHLKGEPENIQLWGGEPLVYIRTLKPLVAELKRLYLNAKFTMITNGSLLTRGINDWIMDNNIGVSMSHDGPGQKYRGPDPFDDPEKADAILDLYRRKKAAGDPMSVGAMIHAQNPDRAAVAAWLREKFHDAEINIGEGSVIQVYDEGAKQNSPKARSDHLQLRETSFRNIRHRADRNFSVSGLRMHEWLDTMQHGRILDGLGMSCGMDEADTLTVDLMGNVLTCQNTSAASRAPNAEPHRAGSIKNLHAVEVKTSVHFMNRDRCHGCPVVQSCRGGCMFLTGDLFDASCDNAFTDHVPYFAAAVEALTGYVPVYIEDDAGRLPDERKDPFGYGKPAAPGKLEAGIIDFGAGASAKRRFSR
jgi:uncharacterized protein